MYPPSIHSNIAAWAAARLGVAQLVLQRGEERFRKCIDPALRRWAYGQANVALCCQEREFMTGGLTTAIGIHCYAAAS